MTREIGIEVRQIGRDPDAFAAFYRAHLQAVQGFVARRVSDPHLAADLTADVFIAAIDSADRYRPERGAAEAWLMGSLATSSTRSSAGRARPAPSRVGSAPGSCSIATRWQTSSTG